MKTRKLLAILLTLAMMMGLLCTGAAATGDTYSYVDDSTTGLRISVSQATEKVQIAASTGNTDYELSSTVSGYFPQSFSLIFTTGTGTSVSLSDSNASFEYYDIPNGYGAVNLSNSSCTITVTTSSGSCTILAPAPAGSASSGSGIMGYLPAAGQFTNEGVTTGGWGDAFTSANNGALKGLVNNYISTGVSLGAFGGYVVLDFGVPHKTNNVVDGGIYNDPGNEFGIDFILYGNVNGTTSEPGCVQVSLDGEHWYDIAGSNYYRQPEVESQTTSNGTTTTVYTPGSEWYYSATYPAYADDALAAGSAGTYPSSPTYTFSSKARTNSSTVTGSGTVTYNTFHRHSWFPLYYNYFYDRTNTANTPLAMQGKALANLGLTNYFGTAYTPTSGTTPSSVTLSGVRLIPRTTVKTGNTNSTTYSYAASDYLFGYADVHPNGTASGSQVNPYDPTTRNYGGDPIDISWAVEPMYTYASDGTATANPNVGQPHYLSAIRYVRVYTGVQQMNGVFGEISTEICGAYRAEETGDGAASTTPTVKQGKTGYAVTHMGARQLTAGNYKLTSSATYVYFNGEAVSASSGYDFSISSGDMIQIITQTGTESPFVTVLYCS